MRIRQSIIAELQTVKNRRTLAGVMNIAEQTVYHHLKSNHDDGILTKLSVLNAMSYITGKPINDLVVDEIIEIISDET